MLSTSPFYFLLNKSVAAETSLDDDDYFFSRALKTAQHVMGTTHPNPAVGAVVVKNKQIISEGFTHLPGGMHAEAHALMQAGVHAQGATLYVTLEPCCHIGRTPPCTDAIIASGITRVVYGAIDPNPKVMQQGIRTLYDAAITTDYIKKSAHRSSALALILPFTTWLKQQRPYVIAKIATSRDGYFAKNFGAATKITGVQSDDLVHEMRRLSDAILVGGSTARIDNPRLTARKGKLFHQQQPDAIVVSSRLMLDENAHLFHREHAKTVVLTSSSQTMAPHVDVIRVGGDGVQMDLAAGMRALAQRGYTCVMAETGPSLFMNLLTSRLIDEVWWFQSSENFGSNGPHLTDLSQTLAHHQFRTVDQSHLGKDHLTILQLIS